jgi:hypothetical protein
MNFVRKSGFALCMGSAVVLSGCGVAGPPRPPSLNLPQPVSDLRALRKGDNVFLAWTVPVMTTDGVKLRQLGVTRICRGAEQPIKNCGSPVGSVAPPPLPQGKSTGQHPQQSYSDELPPSVLHDDPSAQITYAVSVLNTRGRGDGLSNQVFIPAAFALPPPADLRGQATAEGILLSWTGNPEAAETPQLHHLYRVYRREAGGKGETKVGEMPYGSLRSYLLFDHSFEWEKTYIYRATVVTVAHPEGKPEASFEGDDTAPVTVFAHDIFPPAVPSGLQAVFSGVGQSLFVDLLWTPDTEADLAGYNVYRQEAGGAEQKLNSEPLKAPAFRDSNVASGHTYAYSVSAVDIRGNESAHSAPASESVP